MSLFLFPVEEFIRVIFEIRRKENKSFLSTKMIQRICIFFEQRQLKQTSKYKPRNFL